MKTSFLQRLGVESFEDRVLPSHLAFAGAPERPALATRFMSEEGFHRGDHPDRPSRLEPAGLGANHEQVVRQLRDGFPLLGRSDRVVVQLTPAGEQSTPSRPAEPPAAQVAVPNGRPLALLAETPPTVSIAAPVPTPSGTAPTPPTPVEPVSPTVDAPADGTSISVPASVLRAGVVLLGACAVPAVVVGAPVEPSPVPSIAPEPAPAAPTLIERAVEAVLPELTPLAGLLPFHAADLEAAADGLLAKLEDLGVEVSNDLLTPEQWAWVTGFALVAGSVAYTARVHRDRRRARAVPPGTESALARWEDRHADRPA